MSEEEMIAEYREVIWVPVLSVVVAEQMIKNIRPLYRFGQKIKFIKRFNGMFTVNFTNLAEPSNRKTNHLEVFCEIVTFHKKSVLYNFPTPTILEILAQIPLKYLDIVVAFEFVGELEDNNELNSIASKLGYRVGKVRLYSNK